MIAAEADSRGRRMTGAKAAVVTGSSSRTNETRARSASLCVHLVDQLLEMFRLQQQFRFFGLFLEGSEICTYVSDHRINTSNIEGTYHGTYSLRITFHHYDIYNKQRDLSPAPYPYGGPDDIMCRIYFSGLRAQTFHPRTGSGFGWYPVLHDEQHDADR